MTGLGGEERRVQGVPAASLTSIRHCVLRARRARHANILVTGGDAELRAGVVSSIERSADDPHPVCHVSVPRDEPMLRRALRSWLGIDETHSPIACDHGTLFIEGVLEAAPDVQHLLLQLADRLAIGAHAAPAGAAGPVRLAAGFPSEPASVFPTGRTRPALLAALIDRVDKLRVDLGPMPQWSG